jgi:hypothetical protein
LSSPKNPHLFSPWDNNLNHNTDFAEPAHRAARTTTTSSIGDRDCGSRSVVFLEARIVISALVLGLLIGVCGVCLDRLVHHASRIYASDLYTCVIASVFSYLLMIYEKRRRAILARRMAIAAEVNHHIRNALTVIVYSTSVRLDPALQSVLEDATDRIDWVLTTVLPDGEERLKWPVQMPQWRPGEWRGDHQAHSSNHGKRLGKNAFL